MARIVTDRSADRQQGFTLIEMLIALLIISVGLLAMASMSLTVLRTNHQNDVRNAAVRVASDMAEEIYAWPFNSVVSGNETRAVKLRGTGEKAYNVTWDVVSQTNDLKEVTLTIVYDIPGSSIPQTNTAVIYRHRAM